MPIPYSEEQTAVTTPTISWAVTATHNFLSQEITATTPLVTAGISTPGTENYVEDYLLTDYSIVLPQIGTTSHFVSPNQPMFTFTKATRVLLLIPVTTSTDLLKSQGWVYVKNGKLRVPFEPTADNVADFFTKPLTGKMFFDMRDKVMNVPRAHRGTSSDTINTEK